MGIDQKAQEEKAKEWLKTEQNSKDFARKTWDYSVEILKEITTIQVRLNNRKTTPPEQRMDELVDYAVLEMKKHAMMYMYLGLMTSGNNNSLRKSIQEQILNWMSNSAEDITDRIAKIASVAKIPFEEIKDTLIHWIQLQQ